MPMTEKAAQLYSTHQRKADRLWRLWDTMIEHLKKGALPKHYFRVANLAAEHERAKTRIRNCPDSWEKSETDRKLAEIKAYLGSPLYDEWLEAGAAEDFEQYVADEFEKINSGAYATIRGSWDKFTPDPRTLRERLHDEAGADLQRMNSELRGGL